MQNFLTQPEVVNLLALVVSIATVYLSGKLRALLAAKVENTKVEGALLYVNDLMTTVVLDLNQTMAGFMREASADGRVTPEEAAQLKATALARAKHLLGEAGMAKLKSALGLGEDALASFLSSKIEASVAVAKLPPFTMSVETAKKLGLQ